MSARRRRNAEECGSDQEHSQSESDESIDSSPKTAPTNSKTAHCNELTSSESIRDPIEKAGGQQPLIIINRSPIKKDPASVPRTGQFFLHDDRDGKLGHVRPVRVSKDDSWKHDKFDQMSENDNKKTSKSSKQNQVHRDSSKHTDASPRLRGDKLDTGKPAPQVSATQLTSESSKLGAIQVNDRQGHQKSSHQKGHEEQKRLPLERHQRQQMEQKPPEPLDQHRGQQQQSRVPRRSAEQRQYDQQEQRRLQQQHLPPPPPHRSGRDIPNLSATVAGLRVSEREALSRRGDRTGPPAVAYGSSSDPDNSRLGGQQQARGLYKSQDRARAGGDNGQQASRQRAEHDPHGGEPGPRRSGGNRVTRTAPTHDSKRSGIVLEGGIIGGITTGGTPAATSIAVSSPVRGPPPGLDSAVLNPTARIFQPTPAKQQQQLREGSSVAPDEEVRQQSDSLESSTQLSAAALQAAYGSVTAVSAIPSEQQQQQHASVSYLSYYTEQQQRQQQEYDYSMAVPVTYSNGGVVNGVSAAGYVTTTGLTTYGIGGNIQPQQQQHYEMSSAGYAQQLAPDQMMVNAYGQAVPMMYAQQQRAYGDGMTMDADLYGGSMVDGAGGAVWYNSMADPQQQQQQQSQGSGTVYYSVASGTAPSGSLQAQQQQPQQQQYVNYGVSSSGTGTA